MLHIFTGAWWEVDLGGEYQVRSVVIYNRAHSDEFWTGWDRLSNSVVSLLDGDGWSATQYDIGDASNLNVLTIAAQDFQPVSTPRVIDGCLSTISDFFALFLWWILGLFSLG